MEISKGFVGVKSSNTPVPTSDCVKKGAINYSALHLYTKGILYLHKNDKVVKTTFRFCLSKLCITNITSTLNYIQQIIGNHLHKDLNFVLLREEKEKFCNNLLFTIPLKNYKLCYLKLH